MISVRDLEISAHIGAYGHEQGISQPLRLDVTLRVLDPVADALDQAFDYANIRDAALELAGTHINLVETFARRLAERLIDNALVLEANVRVEKPGALPECVAGARVVLSAIDPATNSREAMPDE